MRFSEIREHVHQDIVSKCNTERTFNLMYLTVKQNLENDEHQEGAYEPTN